jgi:YidC/Oxa1 family membrane protein insertase
MTVPPDGARSRIEEVTVNNQRNLLTAVALCALLLLAWDFGMGYFYPQADSVTNAASREDAPIDRAAQAEAGNAAPGADAGAGEIAAAPDLSRDIDSQLAEAGRIAIAAPAISGSINPVGARVDDVTLTRHRQDEDADSGPIRIFAPGGTPAQQFAQFGWIGEGVNVPDTNTRWQASGGPLSPENPVTLRWNNGEGQLFTIEMSVDDNYMITAQQTVANTGNGSIAVQPFGLISRTSATASVDTWTVHSGPLGAFDGSVEFGTDYDDVAEAGGGVVRPAGDADWLGFTDVYWMSALAPQARTGTSADFRSLGNDIYRADLIYDPIVVPAGKQVSRTTKLFVGAKETEVLDAYEAQGLANFGLAIDWGWFRWFERPIFLVLHFLFELVGNFGVAIILLTVLIRLLLFPIAQKQFSSMAQMRAIQPKMKAIQERYKDDKQKQQQEIMGLYKSEGVNPLAGCLPILIQIPIFFALYKTLMLTIEMRHQPFALWIKDLSAPDPATILNLFGLLPFDPPSFLAIGVLALLLGISMWLQFKLNPAAMDPMQQQIFMFMPWVLMFVMAPFAAGLLLYWITNNVLTMAQQWFLYSRHPQLRAQADKAGEKADAEKAKA